MKKTWNSRDFVILLFAVVLAVMMVLALSGCAPVVTNSSAASKPETQAAQVAKKQTESAYTPTPISTAHPAERSIADVINYYLQSSEDALSRTFDATYRVVRVSFSPNAAGNFVAFSIDMDCDCPRNSGCCSPEHAFVLVTRAMKTRLDVFWGTHPNYPSIIPDTVKDFRLECYDHHSQSRVGFMMAPWLRIREYLAGTINEEQLGWDVQRSPTPKP